MRALAKSAAAIATEMSKITKGQAAVWLAPRIAQDKVAHMQSGRALKPPGRWLQSSAQG